MPAYITDNEKRLLTLVAQGDESAFRQLFYLHHHHLGLYIYQLTASREMTEEIVQDIFLKVWTSREMLTEVESFKAWLFVLSRNHALNVLRKVVRERQLQQSWASDEANSQHNVFQDPGNQVYTLLEQAVIQLPAQQKKAFILRRYHHLKYKEIAQEMNISRETVKSYLRIAAAAVSRYVTSRLPCWWALYLGAAIHMIFF